MAHRHLFCHGAVGGGGEVRETSSEFFLQEEQAIIGHINMQWPVLDAS